MRKVNREEAQRIVKEGGEVRGFIHKPTGHYRLEGDVPVYTSSWGSKEPATWPFETYVVAHEPPAAKEPPAPKPERPVSGWAALAVLRAGGEVTQRESNRTYFVVPAQGSASPDYCCSRLHAACLRVRPADRPNHPGNPTPKTLCSIDGFQNGYTVSKEPKSPTAEECNTHIAKGGEVICRDRLARFYKNWYEETGGRPICSPTTFNFSGHVYLDVVTPLGQRSPWFNDAPVAEKCATRKIFHFGNPGGLHTGQRDYTFYSVHESPSSYVDKLTPEERHEVEAIRSRELISGQALILLDVVDRLAPPKPKPSRKATLGEAIDALLAGKAVFKNGRGVLGWVTLAGIHQPSDTYEIEE